MQVTETLSEGLKREYKVVVPAAELDAKVNARLDELKDRVRINGFRPGKVPVTHLKRMYGRSAMAEVIEATVRDTNNQIVSEHGFKLAADPKVTLPTEQSAIEELIAGKTDLNYTMALEIVPPIALGDFKTIKLTKLTADVTDAEVDQASRSHRPAEQAVHACAHRARQAAKDDRVIDLLCGHDRRHAVRRRFGRRRSCAHRIEHVHSGLRGSAHRDHQRRNPHAEGDFSPALHEAGTRRQRCGVRGHGQVRRNARHGRLRTTPLRNRLVSNRSPSFATR